MTRAAHATVAGVARARPQLRDRKPRRFAISGETLIVRVRESLRAQTARIIVGPRRPLEVIVPRGTSDAAVDAFLDEKRRWVERKVADARAIANRRPQLGLERPGVVWLAGRALPLERKDGRRAAARLNGGRLVVTGPDAEAAAAIERWYRREARRRIGKSFAMRRRVSASISDLSPSVTRGRAGGRARVAATSRSRGACCSHRPTSCSTSSFTSCVTCASRATRRRSGGCWSRRGRVGSVKCAGCGSTGKSFTTTDPRSPSSLRAACSRRGRAGRVLLGSRLGLNRAALGCSSPGLTWRTWAHPRSLPCCASASSSGLVARAGLSRAC
jgi:Protein of unknown function DUF45